MNLSELQAMGAFVEAAPIKTPVTWTRDNAEGVEVSDTFDVWIRRRSFGTLERVAMLSEDRSKSAKMLSECVLLGDAQEAITYEQAYQLDPSLAFVLVEAVRDAGAPKS